MPWKRRRRSCKVGRRTGLLLALLGIALIPLGWLRHHPVQSRLPISPNLGDGAKGLQSSDAAPFLNPEPNWLHRPVYPYSVIPGGVESVAEFRQALLRDPVAAGHYSHFDISRSRIQELPVEKIAYVSYRVKDRIFWTSKKVRLHRGERVVTDGVNYARARCGNRISEVPQGEHLHGEPLAAELDTPLIFPHQTLMPVASAVPALPAELISPATAKPAQPSETTSLVPLVPPFGFPYGAASPGKKPKKGCPYTLPYPGAPCKPAHSPPTVVPEPSTVLLISTGLGCMALLKRKAVGSRQ
jgi:hypothetical protein